MAATLAHEMSHALDPEIGTCDYATGELVAESSAHIVSAVLGLDTTPVSTAYLAGWSKGADSLRQVAERALKIANQIINATGIEEAA
jgi:antirestriction protein ArdC